MPAHVPWPLDIEYLLYIYIIYIYDYYDYICTMHVHLSEFVTIYIYMSHLFVMLPMHPCTVLFLSPFAPKMDPGPKLSWPFYAPGRCGMATWSIATSTKMKRARGSAFSPPPLGVDELRSGAWRKNLGCTRPGKLLHNELERST